MLLQIYLVLFWCAIVTGTLLTQTATELRHAEFSVAQQQGYWLAETSVDESIRLIQLDPPLLNPGECTALVSGEFFPESDAALVPPGPPVVPPGPGNILPDSEERPAAFTKFKSGGPSSGGIYTYQICGLIPGLYQIKAVGEAPYNGTVTLVTAVAHNLNESLRYRQAATVFEAFETKHAQILSMDTSFGNSAEALVELKEMFENVDLTSVNTLIAEGLIGNNADMVSLATHRQGGNIDGEPLVELDASVVLGSIAIPAEFARDPLNPADDVELTGGSIYINRGLTNDVMNLNLQQTGWAFPDVDLPPPSEVTVYPEGFVIFGDTTFELQAGTYVAPFLFIGETTQEIDGIPPGVPHVITDGPVTFYVAGNARIYGSVVVGRPADADPYMRNQPDGFSPTNLQLIILAEEGAEEDQDGAWITGATMAATLFVPNNRARIEETTFHGAVIAKQLRAGNNDPGTNVTWVYPNEALDAEHAEATFQVYADQPMVNLLAYTIQRVAIEDMAGVFTDENTVPWDPIGPPSEEGFDFSEIDPWQNDWDEEGMWDWPLEGGGACFAADTLILLPDGHLKPIEQIRVGDTVLAFDEATHQFRPDTVKQVFMHTVRNYLVVNGHLKVTPEHVVYADGRWTRIGDLTVGDQLLNAQGEPEPITSIELVRERTRVYNFEVNPYHTYVAGGVVVHNTKPPPGSPVEEFLDGELGE